MMVKCPQHNHAPFSMDVDGDWLAVLPSPFSVHVRNVERILLRVRGKKKATQQTSCLKCVHENIFVLH